MLAAFSVSAFGRRLRVPDIRFCGLRRQNASSSAGDQGQPGSVSKSTGGWQNSHPSGDTSSDQPRPPPPQVPPSYACCGSGCVDCVWVSYSRKLIAYHAERPVEEVLKDIDELITDVSIREYVKAEIRAMFNI